MSRAACGAQSRAKRAPSTSLLLLFAPPFLFAHTVCVARFAFAVISDLVIVAQANVRGWFKRKIADKQRRARLAEYREQIFKCWKRAHTPLAYRSKFWLLFDGSGFLHVAVHEDELLRLWRDLGVFNSDAGRKLMHTVSTLSSGSGGGDWGDVGEEGGVGDVLNLYSPNGGSLSFYKRFKSVGELLASVEGDEEPVFASEVAAGRGDKDKSMLGKHLVVAAERLKLERMQLYEKMKYSNSDSTKSAYYSMFKLKEGDKKKKQRLCGFLWEEVGLGFESAQVVLRSADDLRGVTARMSTLTSPGGGTIPAADWEVLQQGYVNCTASPVYHPSGGGWHPDPLLQIPPEGIALVPAGLAQPIYLTLCIPRDQHAGTYTGASSNNGRTH